MACFLSYINAKFKHILFVDSLRPIGHCLSQLVQRFANYFDLLWYVFLVDIFCGGGYFWKFEFFWVLKNFCLLVHFAVVLFVYKVAGTHHVMNTDTGWHRHAEETTKYATGVEFHKNTKADFIAMFRRRRERCGCKWGDEVGMNDIPFTISLGGAHCGAGNREAGCKLFKLPVYRAFLPDTPPPHPLSYILNYKIHWNVVFQRDLVQTWKMRYTIFIDAEACIRLTTPHRLNILLT